MDGYAGQRVLVTGAGGFIGSQLVETLVEAGAAVRALVRYSSAGRWGWLDSSPALNEIEVIAGDIRDPETLTVACQQIDIVFHLAALIAIPYSYTTPLAYVRTNVEGTVNVLQAARAAGVARFIHTSTSEVYGTARYVPIDEQHPLQGQSPYSASKIGADKLVESFWAAYALPVVIVRPFNTYGPRQSARAVIPTLITQALTGAPVALGALTPTRDFTFVADTAAGFLAAGRAGDQALGQTINLGVGREISIGDLVKRVEALVGRELKLTHDPERERPAASEVQRLLSNNQRARDLLGWQPQVALDEGLRRTLAWISDHRQLYRPAIYQR